MALTSPQEIFEFGPYRLDAARRVLSRDGVALNLRAKALDLLLILVEQAGQPVGKDELLNRLWPDTEVGEHNLAVTIAALRKALGERSGENLYIATLPGRGYTFVAKVSLTEPDAGRRKPHWGHQRWVVAGCLLILAAASIVAAILGNKKSEITRTSQLTSTGAVSIVAISSDGKRIAFVSGAPGEQAILLGDAARGSPATVLPQAAVRYASLAFTPDGRSLLFVAKAEGDNHSSLYMVRTGDGVAVKVRDNVESAAISPDGGHIAFSRDDSQRGESLLVLHNLRSKEERVLAARKLPNRLEYPAWAPDHQRIACVDVSVQNGVRRSHIVEVALDGSERQIANGPFLRVSGLAWTQNGGTLLASARDHKSGVVRLWSVSAASGNVRPLTNELTDMVGVATDSSGRIAVSVQQKLIVALWTMANGKWSEARRVFYGDTSAGRSAWMPNGDLLLESDFTGGALALLDGLRLTVKPFLEGAPQGYMPAVCANGEDVYYRSSSSSGKGDAIWRTDIRGIKRVEVTHPLQWASLSCTQELLYGESGGADRIGIWRLPSDGGPPVRLTTHHALWPRLSPDGKWIAAFYASSGIPSDRRPDNLAILPAAGGEPVRMFPLPSSAELMPGLDWNAGSNGVYYVQNRKGAGGLWYQPIHGGEASRVVDFPGEQILHFAWSPDWKRLVVSRGVLGQDAVLLEGWND